MSDVREWESYELEIMREAAQNPERVIAERFAMPVEYQDEYALDAVVNFANLAISGDLPIMSDQTVDDLLAMAYNDAISETKYMIESID